MLSKLSNYPEVKSESAAPPLNVSQSSLLANSYPQDIGHSLDDPFTTLTSDGEIKKAFKRAGLR
jgi:hypothetical protein